MAIVVTHGVYVLLAFLLFLAVNLVGRHATSFGYSSTTLFEDANESLALNLLIRTLPPAVLMVFLSALAVASDHENLRLGVYWIAIYYYLIRAVYFPLFNMHRLVSWPRFLLHSALGIFASWAAYQYLILPKNSLLPNLVTAGNELWLAIFIFLYAITNNASFSVDHSARRQNAFIKHSYDRAKLRYGLIIESRIKDDQLELITYAIIVYENYCRPPAIRAIERLCFWKKLRTTGVMQVAADKALSDDESVLLGTDFLLASWQVHQADDSWGRARSVICEYNKDDNYVMNVMEVMRILAKRTAPYLEDAYESIFERQQMRYAEQGKGRSLKIRRAKYLRAKAPKIVRSPFRHVKARTRI